MHPWRRRCHRYLVTLSLRVFVFTNDCVLVGIRLCHDAGPETVSIPPDCSCTPIDSDRETTRRRSRQIAKACRALAETPVILLLCRFMCTCKLVEVTAVDPLYLRFCVNEGILGEICFVHYGRPLRLAIVSCAGSFSIPPSPWPTVPTLVGTRCRSRGIANMCLAPVATSAKLSL